MWGLSDRVTGNIAGVTCMMAWSTSFIFVNDLLATWHPLLLTPARTAMAAVVLCLLTVIIGRGRELLQIPVVHMAGAGGIGLTAANTLLVFGQNYVDPVSTAIIISCLPAVSAVFGWFGGTERLSVLLCAGIGLSVVGGAVASLGLESGAAGEGSIIGAVIIALGVVAYIWYTRTIVMICPEVSPLAKAGVCMLVATLMGLIIAEFGVLLELVPLKYDVSMPSLGKLLWLGAIAVGGSTALWFLTGQLIGVTVASMHHNLVPLYVMMMALFAGGSIGTMTLTGATLVIAGAVLAQLPELRKRPKLAD